MVFRKTFLNILLGYMLGQRIQAFHSTRKISFSVVLTSIWEVAPKFGTLFLQGTMIKYCTCYEDYKKYYKRCPTYHHHKEFYIHPEKLVENRIPYYVIVQKPMEIVILSYKVSSLRLYYYNFFVLFLEGH